MQKKNIQAQNYKKLKQTISNYTKLYKQNTDIPPPTDAMSHDGPRRELTGEERKAV